MSFAQSKLLSDRSRLIVVSPPSGPHEETAYHPFQKHSLFDVDIFEEVFAVGQLSSVKKRTI